MLATHDLIVAEGIPCQAVRLDSGKINLNSSFDARVPLRYGKFSIHDYHAQRRMLTVPEVRVHRPSELKWEARVDPPCDPNDGAAFGNQRHPSARGCELRLGRGRGRRSGRSP